MRNRIALAAFAATVGLLALIVAQTTDSIDPSVVTGTVAKTDQAVNEVHADTNIAGVRPAERYHVPAMSAEDLRLGDTELVRMLQDARFREILREMDSAIIVQIDERCAVQSPSDPEETGMPDRISPECVADAFPNGLVIREYFSEADWGEVVAGMARTTEFNWWLYYRGGW